MTLRSDRRGFLQQLAALFALGAAAPTVLAKLRAPSWETADPDVYLSTLSLSSESPYHIVHNDIKGNGIVTLSTNRGTYRAPIVDGVADFSKTLPNGGQWIFITDINGDPAQVKL